MENNDIMEPSAFTDLSRQIIEANGDQGKITSLLTQLQDGYAKLFATHSDVSKDNTTLTEENTRLKEYNLELFMQHGQKLKEEAKRETGEPDTKTRAETIKCEDLFKKEE